MPIGKSNQTVDLLNDSAAADLRFDRSRLVVTLTDGREIAVPLRLYPTLARAGAAQRDNWQLIGPGKAFHWPDLDLDLSVFGLINALPEATPPPPSPPPDQTAAAAPVDRHTMQRWVQEALQQLGGAGSALDVCRTVWRNHQHEIEAAGDVLFKWQYEIRQAADLLRRSGRLRSAAGRWQLAS
ncbi:MAG: DUF2442 domain-containing protein [Phycisphaeraceae bacterium]|nr:DUF2442 domain-containing protein [Phycisphaeraceae bacterium]